MRRMVNYGEWSPTPFDCKGLMSTRYPELLDFDVAPVIQTRDSGTFEQSNFDCFVKACEEVADQEAEEREVQVHRFGHWGPGWYEVALIKRGTKAHDVALELCAWLDQHPCVDEEDYSRREWEEASEAWARASERDRIDWIKRYCPGASIFAARRDELPEDDTGELVIYLGA